jgi:hypothetical protein
MAIKDFGISTVSLKKVVTSGKPGPTAFAETTSASHSSSTDVLRQFQTNMATLEDLSGRLRFMMTEIRSLVK